MAKIEIHYNKRTPEIIRSEEVVSGQLRTIEVQFTFSEEWEGYPLRTAVFTSRAASRLWPLDEEGNAKIPGAVIRSGVRSLTVSVFGFAQDSDGEYQRYNGKPAAFRVELGGNIPGEGCPDADPSAYEVIIASLNAKLDAYQGIDNADRALVVGKDGVVRPGDYAGSGSGGIEKETDPTVPDWAKKPQKPTYTPDEIGAQPAGDYALRNEIPAVPVQSVNGKTGAVQLGASDVGARPAEWMPSASDVGALPASTKIPGKTSDLQNDSGYITVAVASLLNYYLKSETYAKGETYSRTEVDALISGLDKRLNAIADSDDITLDQLSEIVAYIKSNKSLIDSITTSKVSVADIVDNLTTSAANKPLSAAQGVVLKALIDALSTGKLDAAALPEAINTALAQAKESGEFDGQSAAVTVEETEDGAVITATDKNGTTSAEVKNGKSAWRYAQDGGYTGTEAEFAEKMAGTQGLYVSVPDYVHVKTDSEFKVYYRNILTRDDAVLWVGSHAGLTTRYYNDYLSITAGTAGTFALPWKVYDKGGNLLGSGSLHVIAAAKVPVETTKIIVIGDSTVNAGTMQNKTAALYAENGATLSLLGTRGGATHEGRGGWTAQNYCTAESKDGIENPFYNNGFDFAYYMTNQAYSDVAAVVIQLGINDVFPFKDAAYDSTAALGYIRQMVTSILAYSSSIKVILNLPTTPNSNGTGFTETYGTSQLYWVYNRNIIRFAKELKDYFAANTRVTVSASNCILDTETQIRDGVHPTEDGYNALGQRLYEVLISVTDGTAVIVPLLDVMQRTLVRHADRTSQTTIGPTATRELDPTKCYDGQYIGSRSISGSNAVTYTPISSDSFSLSLSAGASSGFGVEFTVPQLEVGKTYTLKWTADVAQQRVYVLTYNSDTTYNTNTMLGSGTGTKTVTITPEEGYIYSLFFSTLVLNTVSTYSDISLTED